MSEAVSTASASGTNDIAVMVGNIFGNILLVALFVVPIILLYFVIANFRKLLREVKERHEIEAAEARAVELRNHQLSEMETQENGEGPQESGPGEKDDSAEDRG